ncbi:MAG: hypothetical protein IVW53_00270 [Chloroflexi bacterium]|nr:hypothetical protein [Chloroflexota bacterium]
MARDAIAAFLGIASSSVEVEVIPRLAADLEATVTKAGRVREAAELMHREAANLTRAAVVSLADAGLTVRDIGRVVGLSHQRVAQILAQPADAAPSGSLVDLMAALEASVSAARMARGEANEVASGEGKPRPHLVAAAGPTPWP